MIDRKISAVTRIVMAALAVSSLASLSACANTDSNSMDSDPSGRPGQRRALEQGERLYKVSCSSCHGVHAHGNGPVAPLLKVPVPDLTFIASRRNGVFPEDEVYRIVDGQADLTAHGPRHMPIWGYEFFGDEPDDEAAHREATEKIERLVRYLQSIQRTR